MLNNCFINLSLFFFYRVSKDSGISVQVSHPQTPDTGEQDSLFGLSGDSTQAHQLSQTQVYEQCISLLTNQSIFNCALLKDRLDHSHIDWTGRPYRHLEGRKRSTSVLMTSTRSYAISQTDRYTANNLSLHIWRVLNLNILIH